jgi:hypothetical protein
MDSRVLRPGSSFRFVFDEAQGAALVTKHLTYTEDASEMGNFEKYTKENYASWVEFACKFGDVEPVLVTGVDLTKDFAMMCFSDYDPPGLACEFVTSASGIVSPWGTWRSSGHVFYDKFGPNPHRPPSIQTMDLASSGNTHAGTIPEEFTQCVFVRYFGMVARRLRAPKIIKAGAGPHDLGTGGRDGGGSPLQAQYDSGSGSEASSSSLDDNRDNDMGSVTSIESESDILIHNPAIVRHL